MSFTYPWVLWGMLALAIPLLVHLFNFRRTKKVFFSNVSFLQKVETQTSSFRRLKQWLVMAARMAALACLVFAFAQPFLPASKSATKTDMSVKSIYLDNSLSMQNTVDNKRFIDLAVIKLNDLLDVFGAQADIQFIDNDFDGLDRQLKTGSQIQEELTSLDLSPHSKTLESVYRRQKGLVNQASEGKASKFFWISDFQKSTLGELNNIEIDSSDQLYIVPIKANASSNVFVDSVWTAVPFIREMQNNLLKVKLVNSGTKPIENLPIKLKIDENQSSGTSVSIPPGKSVTAEINFNVKTKGEHRAQVSFEDQPITFDNTYYFTLTASPAIKILHLYQERSTQDYIGKLLSNDSLFDYRAFNSRSIDFEQIEGNNLVILEGIPNVTSQMSTRLKRFAKEGGSFIYIPHSNADSANTAKFFGSFGLRMSQVEEASKAVSMAFPETGLGFFADVFDISQKPENTDLPRVKPVLNWTGVGQTLLRRKDGRSFLSAIRSGKGHGYFFSAPFIKEYTTFAEHALFVPTFFKMASESVPSQRLAFTFGDANIQLEVPEAKQSDRAYSLYNEGVEIIPSQRVVNGLLSFKIPSLSELGDGQELSSGYYELRQGNKTLKTFAFNNEREESYLGSIALETLKAKFKGQENVKIFDDLREGGFVDTYRSENIGKDLWTYFLWASLVFFLLEVLLIRFMKT